MPVEEAGSSSRDGHSQGVISDYGELEEGGILGALQI